MGRYSHKPFAQALAEIVRELYPDPRGNLRLKPVFEQAKDYTYESLRRMELGEQALTMKAVEAITEVLQRRDPTLEPFYFMEYRQMWAALMTARYPDIMDQSFELVCSLVSAKESSSRSKKSKGSAT